MYFLLFLFSFNIHKSLAMPTKIFRNIIEIAYYAILRLSYTVLNHFSLANHLCKLKFSTNANDFVSDTSVYK